MMKIRPLWLISGLLLLCATLFLLLDFIRAGYLMWTKPAHLAEPVLVTISPATTRITAPLQANGYPDYVAALNERLSKDVTPDNNMVVLLQQLIGPKDMDQKKADLFYQRLGMAPPPADGKYLRDWTTYCNDLTAEQIKSLRPFLIRKRAEKAEAGIAEEPADGESENPPEPEDQRTAEEIAAADLEELKEYLGEYDEYQPEKMPPEVRELFNTWLTDQRPLYEQALKLRERPGFYYPYHQLQDSETYVLSLPLEHIQQARRFALVLAPVAKSAADAGRLSSATEGLLAIHHLRQGLAKQLTVVEKLVAVAISGIAFEQERYLVTHPDWTIEQLAAWATQHEQYRPNYRFDEAIDIGERYMGLDSVCYLARTGNDWQILTGGSPDKNPPPSSFVARTRIDYDIALTDLNSFYDRITAAFQMTDRQARLQAINAIESDLQKIKQESEAAESKILSFLSRDHRSQQFSRIAVNLFGIAITAAQKVGERGRVHHDLIQLAISLQRHKLQHGAYPDKLATVAADLPKVSLIDPFSGKTYVYRSTGVGYLLYSVGQNGIDENGLSEATGLTPNNEDDISVFTPDMKPVPPEPEPLEPIPLEPVPVDAGEAAK